MMGQGFGEAVGALVVFRLLVAAAFVLFAGVMAGIAIGWWLA